MKPRFTIAQLLRSTALFSFGVWTLTWFWSYPHMTKAAIFLAPVAFAGAIGALFGRAIEGAFWGCAFEVGLVALAAFVMLLYVVGQIFF
jgi:hypothetical protein